MEIQIRKARADDTEAWLRLARTVEPLFGPMADVPEFRAGLGDAIAGGTAIAAETASAFAGGIVVDRCENAIAWLAVAPEARGLGIGAGLLRAALDLLDRTRPVAVQTFAPSCGDAGAAARSLYGRFGFVDGGQAEPTPAGLATVMMTRPAAA
jgi:GNAT superfamily N-acetyltransferase